MDARRVVRFGSFELDVDSGELRSNGRRVALQGQPAQVLSLLVRHPGQVVSRDELRRAIWADDTFVDFEAALNVAVNKVRQALHDSASAPRFIETVPKRGYRFLADVHTVDVGVPEMTDVGGVPDTPRESSRRFPSFLAARPRLLTALMFAIALPLLWSAQRRDAPAGGPKSLAVLPFRPLVAESRDEALEVGLTESVIVRLGQLKQMRVPSIYAVQRYARLDPDPRTAGRELGVDAVLEGSVLRLNGNVRLSVRLLDVAKGTTLWAHQWDIPWTDIFTVQDVMAREVSRALAVSLAAEADAKPHPPTSVAAYDDYLRARYLLRQRTLASSRRAAELLEDVIKVDPKSAAAYASLAFAYISVPLLEGPSVPFVDRGRQAARRALDLDPTVAEAHGSLGRIMIHFDWDADGGEREMRRALELGPDNGFVLHCYSLVLADEGRYDEALALADRALALDPTSVLANRDKAMILLQARRYEESIEQSRRTLELDRYSGVAYFVLGRAYEYLNRPEQAIEAYITPFTFSEKNRDLVAALRAAAGRGSLKGFWERRLQSLLEEPEVRTYSVASAYMRIGDHDRALEWLEKLYAERGAWIRGLKTRAEWDPLRRTRRFQDLLRRANMAPMPLLSRTDLDNRKQAIRLPDE